MDIFRILTKDKLKFNLLKASLNCINDTTIIDSIIKNGNDLTLTPLLEVLKENLGRHVLLNISLGEKLLNLFYYVKTENFIETMIVKNKILKLSDKKSNFLTNNIFYAVENTIKRNYSNENKIVKSLKNLNKELIIDIYKNSKFERNLIDTIIACKEKRKDPYLLRESLDILSPSQASINNAKLFMKRIGYNLDNEMQN